MPAPRAEVGDPDAGERCSRSVFVPHLGLGAGVEHVEPERSEILHRRAQRSSLMMASAGFSQSVVYIHGPGNSKLVLSVAFPQLVFRQPEIPPARPGTPARRSAAVP